MAKAMLASENANTRLQFVTEVGKEVIRFITRNDYPVCNAGTVIRKSSWIDSNLLTTRHIDLVMTVKAKACGTQRRGISRRDTSSDEIGTLPWKTLTLS